jgi:nucleoid DNA-binding protein
VTGYDIARFLKIPYPTIEKFLELMLAALRQGREVHLQSFGMFRCSDGKERLIANLNPGRVDKIPKKKTVRFRGSKTINLFVNGKLEKWA